MVLSMHASHFTDSTHLHARVDKIVVDVEAGTLSSEGGVETINFV